MKLRKIDKTMTGPDGNSGTANIPIHPDEYVLTAGDLMRRLGIGKDLLAELIDDGNLPVVKFGKRRRYFDVADIAKLIEEKKLWRAKTSTTSRYGTQELQRGQTVDIAKTSLSPDFPARDEAWELATGTKPFARSAIIGKFSSTERGRRSYLPKG
jgi:hypothetical protein